MKRLFVLVCGLGMTLPTVAQHPSERVKTITKNGMAVQWYCTDRRIHFEMQAPTKGWVAVGIHEEPSLNDAYLVMGTVDDGTVIVAEHYLHGPGDYQRLSSLDSTNWIKKPGGEETTQGTKIMFSLPLDQSSRYRTPLHAEQPYYLTLAYSREDNFQHHSIMRVSLPVTL